MRVFNEIDKYIEDIFFDGEYFVPWIDDENGEEICIDDGVERILNDNKIEDYEINLKQAFSSPSYDVYSFNVSWIEDGKLQVYDQILEVV